MRLRPVGEAIKQKLLKDGSCAQSCNFSTNPFFVKKLTNLKAGGLSVEETSLLD